jgi:putative multiple sugar transport system substrate-binding protein
MRRPAAAALAVALAAAVLTGCTSAPSAPTIGVALPSASGRWGDVAEVLRARLQGAGYTVVLRAAKDDIPTQVRQVAELLDLHPDALIVAPVDPSSLTAPLDDVDPDIEVVTLGTLVRDTGAIDRLIGFDSGVEGFLQATALLQGLGLVDATGAAIPEAPRGPFRIELFAGSPDEDRTEPAFAAAMSVLQPYLDRRILSVGSGDAALEEVETLRGNADTAASRMTRILRDTYADGDTGQQFPDAVLAPSDEIARGIAGALIDAGDVVGPGFTVLSGRGAQLRSLAALTDGRQFATLLEDPRLLAREAADQVIAALAVTPGVPAAPTDAPPGSAVDNGARLVPASLLQPVLVHVDEIESLVVDSGYWTRARVDRAIAEFGLASG